MRQVSAAERAVPVAAVALAAVKLGAGLIEERLVAEAASPSRAVAVRFWGGRGVRGELVQAPADHLHAGVHFVGFGILHFEVSPVAAANERGDFVPTAFMLPIDV